MVEECKRAVEVVIKLVQQEAFSKQIRMIEKGNTLESSFLTSFTVNVFSFQPVFCDPANDAHLNIRHFQDAAIFNNYISLINYFMPWSV